MTLTFLECLLLLDTLIISFLAMYGVLKLLKTKLNKHPTKGDIIIAIDTALSKNSQHLIDSVTRIIDDKTEAVKKEIEHNLEQRIQELEKKIAA